MRPMQDDSQAERRHAGIMAHLEHIAQAITHAVGRIEEALPRRPQRVTASLSSGMAPLKIRTRGYRHNRIWAPVSLTVDLRNTTGLVSGWTLSAGWNPLDLDDESEISNASAKAIIIVELTDYAI